MREFKAGTETETVCRSAVTGWLIGSCSACFHIAQDPRPPPLHKDVLGRVTSYINHQLRHFLTDLATGQSSLGSSSVAVLFPGDYRLDQVDNRNFK